MKSLANVHGSPMASVRPSEMPPKKKTRLFPGPQDLVLFSVVVKSNSHVWLPIPTHFKEKKKDKKNTENERWRD